MIFEGSTEKRFEYCKNEDGILCYLRSIQRHSGGTPELMDSVLIPHKWKKYVFIEDFHGTSTRWKRNQDAVSWVRLQNTQDQ